MRARGRSARYGVVYLAMWVGEALAQVQRMRRVGWVCAGRGRGSGDGSGVAFVTLGGGGGGAVMDGEEEGLEVGS